MGIVPPEFCPCHIIGNAIGNHSPQWMIACQKAVAASTKKRRQWRRKRSGRIMPAHSADANLQAKVIQENMGVISSCLQAKRNKNKYWTKKKSQIHVETESHVEDIDLSIASPAFYIVSSNSDSEIEEQEDDDESLTLSMGTDSDSDDEDEDYYIDIRRCLKRDAAQTGVSTILIGEKNNLSTIVEDDDEEHEQASIDNKKTKNFFKFPLQ